MFHILNHHMSMDSYIMTSILFVDESQFSLITTLNSYATHFVIKFS